MVHFWRLALADRENANDDGDDGAARAEADAEEAKIAEEESMIQIIEDDYKDGGDAELAEDIAKLETEPAMQNKEAQRVELRNAKRCAAVVTDESLKKGFAELFESDLKHVAPKDTITIAGVEIAVGKPSEELVLDVVVATELASAIEAPKAEVAADVAKQKVKVKTSLMQPWLHGHTRTTTALRQRKEMTNVLGAIRADKLTIIQVHRDDPSSIMAVLWTDFPNRRGSTYRIATNQTVVWKPGTPLVENLTDCLIVVGNSGIGLEKTRTFRSPLPDCVVPLLYTEDKLSFCYMRFLYLYFEGKLVC